MMAVVVICLSLGLAVALGWIFYQNFIHKEPENKETELVVVGKDDKKSESKVEEKTQARVLTYTSDNFEFIIPSDWKVASEDEQEILGSKAVIVSSDYKPAEHRTFNIPDKGAFISIREQSVAEAGKVEKPSESDAHGISDIQTISVGGVTGYYYQVDYEGTRYQLEFQEGNTRYMMSMQANGEATREQKDAFNQVWKSLKFRN